MIAFVFYYVPVMDKKVRIVKMKMKLFISCVSFFSIWAVFWHRDVLHDLLLVIIFVFV